MKESAYCDARMEAYCVEVQKLEDKFDVIEIDHVLLWDNKEVDALVRLAYTRKAPPPRVFLDILDAPSICLKGVKPPAPTSITATLNTIARGASSLGMHTRGHHAQLMGH